MDREQFLATIHDESTALLAAARLAAPDAPVPGCPAWTPADLLWHIGKVQDFWGWVVRERSLAPAEYEDPPRPGAGLPPDDEIAVLATYAGERAAELHRVLTAADPDTPVWTWTGERDVAWIARRTAHEAAVHRVDAEAAAGREHRLDPALAADGIDEFLTYFLPMSAAGVAPLVGSVHLHCTDADGEWTIRPDGDAVSVSRDHAKADAALRGPAHDLLMALWRRSPLDSLDVFGDTELAAAFVARPRLE